MPERAAALRAYVEAGGILVIGCRSGYKNLSGRCVMDKLPGLLSDLSGTDIPEYSFIAPDAGKVYYYGTAFNAESARVFLEKFNVISPYRDVIHAPEGCEIAVRKKGDDRYLFVLNYDKYPAQIELFQKGTDLYTGKEVSGQMQLEGYQTLVVKL